MTADPAAVPTSPEVTAEGSAGSPFGSLDGVHHRANSLARPADGFDSTAESSEGVSVATRAALARDLLRTVDMAVAASCTSVDEVRWLLAGMIRGADEAVAR